MNPSLEWKTAENNTFQTSLSNFWGRMTFRSKVMVFLSKKKYVFLFSRYRSTSQSKYLP